MLIYGLTIDDNIYTPEIEGMYSDFIYLHGKVEDMNVGGFDLVYIPDMPKESGVYDCEVRLCNHEELIPCKFFYWTVPIGKITDVFVFGGSEDASIRPDPKNPTVLIKDRGLIVKIDDKEHLLDAQRKFDERTPYL